MCRRTMAVIHQYMRETHGGLRQDDARLRFSHTRYGALGTMGVGEGGPELVKQLLRTAPMISPIPDVVADLPDRQAAARASARRMWRWPSSKQVFDSGFVKNKVMEFVGPGIANLTVEFRNGIDVMTTETTCLSSIWETDEHGEGLV